MSILEVGREYADGQRCWPPAVHYRYGIGGHQLILFVNGVTRLQESDLVRGRVELVFILDWGEVTVCSRFGETIPWCHSDPFRWHRVPNEGRELPADPELTPGLRVPLRVALVEAEGGTVKALRSLLLTSALTSALHAAIRGQASHAAQAVPPLWSVAKLYCYPDAIDFGTLGRPRYGMGEEF